MNAPVGESTVEVETPIGPGRLHLVHATPEPAAVLIMGHGAGGGIGAVDLAALAALLPPRGIAVARYEQPWRLAGRKVASPPPTLDVGWIPAVQRIRAELPQAAVVTGGRSAGARVACRTAGEVGADGVVCCAFPLHPPGRPDRSRLPELIMPAALTPPRPVLVLQGTRDTFGTAADVRAAIGAPGPAVAPVVIDVPGADHGMRVASAASGHQVLAPAAVRALLADSVAHFVGELVRRGAQVAR